MAGIRKTRFVTDVSANNVLGAVDVELSVDRGEELREAKDTATLLQYWAGRRKDDEVVGESGRARPSCCGDAKVAVAGGPGCVGAGGVGDSSSDCRFGGLLDAGDVSSVLLSPLTRKRQSRVVRRGRAAMINFGLAVCGVCAEQRRKNKSFVWSLSSSRIKVCFAMHVFHFKFYLVV